MKRINEILAVVILSLMAVLLAAVGMRLYDTYIIDQEMESEIRQQEEVLSRNREAHDRVQEMRREIEELSEDREKLGQFLEEIRMDDEEAVPVSSMMDFDMSGMSGNLAVSEESEHIGDISGNTTSVSDHGFSVPGGDMISDNTLNMFDNDTISGNTTSVSGNDAVSGNTTSVSGNDAVSGNGLSVSDNDAVSGNSLSVSGNDAVSGNTTSVSDNDAVSGNSLSVSGNDVISGNTTGVSDYVPGISDNGTVSENETVSGNMIDILPRIEMVYPEITLAKRRQIRSSLEETLLVNWEDQACLEERGVDFSGKKIACLGDSITAAANLEGEEGYLSYAYPAVLKELLGAEEVYNLGIGGSSIGRYWSDAFVERYKQIPEDTDIIIVMGGTNDGFCLSEKEFGSPAERKPWTFWGDLDELMRGLKENYPDADIFFATPLPNILQDYLMRERTYLLPQKNIADVILTLSAAHGFQVIDLYNSNMLDSHDADIVADYMPDGVHANKEGYRILAEHIAARLVRYYEENE
ncbi:MAG: hypothetical protein K2H37_14280 [Lachnospiraceae bacterium]|nr:hypothetical protein [Lachnospiraceae bacterium]